MITTAQTGEWLSKITTPSPTPYHEQQTVLWLFSGTAA
jgi:hypothetical protein